jgi:hypothetical protein
VIVAALYVATNGSYAGVPDVEMWDQQRDARLYDGPHRVIAHPPCSSWCQLASVNQARWGAMIGDDGGCFAAALASVRRFGGILEHPAYSIAWSRHGLQPPRRGSWQASLYDVGLVTEVSQSAYGHPARKRTWLYSVEVEPFDLDWSDRAGTHVIGAGVNTGECTTRTKLSGYGTIGTPPSFRDALLAAVRR